MKILITIAILSTLVATTGIPNSGAEEGQKSYTAYNIWRTSKMKCINFKQGSDIIPAGTEVKDVRLRQSSNPFLNFTTVEDDREYTVSFNPRWHPKKKISDYMKMMFTTKNFEELTMGLTEIEIKAIKEGILVNGMSKNAVLISYGLPPEHYTPNQDAMTWFYWMNRRDKVETKFNLDGKLVLGSQSSQDDDFTSINIVDRPYHIGDDIVKRFTNPKPQGVVFVGKFDLTDTNFSKISIVIWLSDMVPKHHNSFRKGYHKNKLIINGSEIALLNNYVPGSKDRSAIRHITIELDKHILKKGTNEIKIIGGLRQGNYDDFQIHKLMVKF